MPQCTVEVPPEVRFADGVRVACHLYPPGSEGTLSGDAANLVIAASLPAAPPPGEARP